MKWFFYICLCLTVISCSETSLVSGNQLSSLIKPPYQSKQSNLSCTLNPQKTLSDVEGSIAKILEAIKAKSLNLSGLLFLFPLEGLEINTSQFDIVLRFSDPSAIEGFVEILDDEEFSSLASCGIFSAPSSFAPLRMQPSEEFLFLAESLSCEYLDGYSYASLSLVLEQFLGETRDNKNLSGISYVNGPGDTKNFQWVNAFVSQDGRDEFLESWLESSKSRRYQRLFMEQSTCNSSNLYRAYKVL